MSDGVAAEIHVRVIPRAKKTTVSGERDGAIVIRLAAPPVDGAANAALIEFLSDILDLPRRQIRIVSGEKNRTKRVAIAGLALNEIRQILTR